MGEGMPYHLEKGPTLRILEQKLNGPRTSVCKVLNAVRANPNDPLGWLDAVPGLWSDDRFEQAAVAPRTNIVQDWFGYARMSPADPWTAGSAPTTGYWIGYSGNVGEIVRRAIQWALELSLGVNAGDGQNCTTGPPPLPIELFWKCPAPWFEAWVVRRPVGEGKPNGLVSIVFMTPSHRGANVAESPVAKSDKTKVAGGALHPVPSREADYFMFTPSGAKTTTPDERIRPYAMWVVTHEDHKTDPTVKEQFTTNTAAGSDFTDWGIPYLSIYRGTGNVVVVSPSLAAGGVRIDGAVP
jgi:hypothetical protein